MKIFSVILDCGTTGTIAEDTIDYQSAENFIGEIMKIQTNDENGNPIEVTGKLIDVLN